MLMCIPLKGESTADVIIGSSNKGRPVSSHREGPVEAQGKFGCSSFCDLFESSHKPSLQFSGSHFFTINFPIFNKSNKFMNQLTF